MAHTTDETTPPLAHASMLWVVTRHPGATRWLDRQPWPVQAPLVRWVQHLNPDDVEADHAVIGTLPIHVVSALCARGVRYWHLQFDAPPDSRGMELTDDELIALRASLTEYRAHVVPPAKEFRQ